jgi:hypothetical protein
MFNINSAKLALEALKVAGHTARMSTASLPGRGIHTRWLISVDAPWLPRPGSTCRVENPRDLLLFDVPAETVAKVAHLEG